MFNRIKQYLCTHDYSGTRLVSSKRRDNSNIVIHYTYYRCKKCGKHYTKVDEEIIEKDYYIQEGHKVRVKLNLDVIGEQEWNDLVDEYGFVNNLEYTATVEKGYFVIDSLKFKREEIIFVK